MMGQSVWLVEWLEQQVFPDPQSVRWWHPEYGWSRNAQAAIQFVRKEDAEAYIKEHLFHWAKATEHMFVVRAQ